MATGLLVVSCARDGNVGNGPQEPATAAASETPPTIAGPTPARHSTPRHPMSVQEARRYMVSLINADRATLGLPPVELDEGAPTSAGQRHAEDMASRGYLGHWGTDGSTPEQRYTEAGGEDMVLENASCFVDEHERVLDSNPGIEPKDIERAEEMFFNEVPPHDGHRKNILKRLHTKVGVGIAQPVATATEIPVPCFTQEFVDDYGSYGQIRRQMRVGDMLHVEGTLTPTVDVAGVGLARVDAPKALSPGEANHRRSYPVPGPYQMYYPPAYTTPIPLRVTGKSFTIDIPLNDRGLNGMYEVSVWAKVPGSKELEMISLRTIRVY
jgi:uncharacterized protein YkwD